MKQGIGGLSLTEFNEIITIQDAQSLLSDEINKTQIAVYSEEDPAKYDPKMRAHVRKTLQTRYLHSMINLSFFHVLTKACYTQPNQYTYEEKKDTRKDGLDTHEEGISTQKLIIQVVSCSQRDRISPSKRSSKRSQRE